MTAASFVNQVSGWVDSALGLIYPQTCQICRRQRATTREGFVCGECRDGVRWILPPCCGRCGQPFEGNITTEFVCSQCQQQKLHFSFARAAVAARSTVLEAIHQYKYQRALWLEPFLAELLVQPAAGQLRDGGWDALVPVPLNPVKEREREFNQAERLARRLSAATGIPLGKGLVRRVRHTRSQTLLTREEREENMRGAFEANERKLAALALARMPAEPPRLVIVDDVFTTGATSNAVAGALRRAGAGEVCVWTVARGI